MKTFSLILASFLIIYSCKPEPGPEPSTGPNNQENTEQTGGTETPKDTFFIQEMLGNYTCSVTEYYSWTTTDSNGWYVYNKDTIYHPDTSLYVSDIELTYSCNINGTNFQLFDSAYWFLSDWKYSFIARDSNDYPKFNGTTYLQVESMFSPDKADSLIVRAHDGMGGGYQWFKDFVWKCGK